jgi:SAM-dependent methyltransferase
VSQTLPSVGYTYDFIRDSLPEGTKCVLEVGCGSGELAALLIADGLQVTAIDADADCVAKARGEGVDAKLMSWPVSLDERFDAVLFTRSLHHVDDLPEAIGAAQAALTPGGRIIVDDFCAEGVSERSTRWFEALARELHAGGKLSPDVTVAALLDQAAPPSSHDHHLHSSGAIARELGQDANLRETDAAYYFRYLEPHLTDASAEAVLEHELAMIAQGSIDALGKRFIASAS